MSDETKRDVFEDAAFTIETASPDGPEFAGELRRRYAAALPDETDDQKSCIYCHNKHFQKISQKSYSFWYRNKRFKPQFCGHCGRKL